MSINLPNKSIKDEPLNDSSLNDSKSVIDKSSYKIMKPQNKIKGNFFVEDGKTIFGTLLENVIIPGLKKLFLDGVTNAATTAVYGTKGNPNKNSVKIGGSFVNSIGNIAYGSMSTANRAPFKPITNSVYSVTNIEFNSVTAARTVLDSMNDILAMQGCITVNQYYDILGIPSSNPNDENFGWRDLSNTVILPQNDGYILSFPKVVTLINK